MLDNLWNEYWMQTLSSSPLLNNRDFISNSVSDLAFKLHNMERENRNKGKGKQGDAKNKMEAIEK
jgi:COP9 signalosome complex subunit 5